MVQETVEVEQAVEPTGTHQEVSAVEFRKSIDAGGLVLAKFGAPWCGPCVQVDAELDILEESNGDQLTVVRVNVDEEPELTEDYDISAIPKLLLFKDGKQIEEWLGYEEADVFQESIDRAITNAASVGEVQDNDLVEAE